MKTSRPRHALLCALLLALAPLRSPGGAAEIMKAVQESDFRFSRSTSEVPFMPMAWAQNRYYTKTTLEDTQGIKPEAVVFEDTINFGFVMPTYVAKRDMVVVGMDTAWDKIEIRSGPYEDQSILRITPIFGYMRQIDQSDLFAAFVAPIFSKEMVGGGAGWGTSAYSGVIGMHWSSDSLQWIYGGVLENSYGRRALYPYAGLMWLPTPKCSLSLIIPWPTITYTPRDRWLLQLGLAPGGSSWVGRADGYETTLTFGSFTLNAGASYRLHGRIWLYGGAGIAGLRGLKIGSDSDRPRFDAQPGPVFTLALHFRP
jgi:opacity protein-like surface antigen